MDEREFNPGCQKLRCPICGRITLGSDDPSGSSVVRFRCTMIENEKDDEAGEIIGCGYEEVHYNFPALKRRAKESPDSYLAIRDIVGIEAWIALRKVFGGMSVKIPKLDIEHTPQDDREREMVKLYDAGKTPQEIAKLQKVSVYKVYAGLRRLNRVISRKALSD